MNNSADYPKAHMQLGSFKSISILNNWIKSKRYLKGI